MFALRDDELSSLGVAGFPRAAGMLWGVTRNFAPTLHLAHAGPNSSMHVE